MAEHIDPRPGQPAYLSAYGLHRAPFDARVEDDMFFADTSRGQRLDILINLTQYSNEVLLVCAPLHGGKTSLLQQFLHRASSTWQLCRIDGHSNLDPQAFTRALAQGFALPFDAVDQQGLLHSLRDYFESLTRCAQKAVIVVDDAHLLPYPTLDLLIHLCNPTAADATPLLRCVLFGEPHLAELMTGGQAFTAPKDLRRFELLPLTAEETAGYIRHRLSKAGLVSEGPFTPGTLERIHRQSGGLPGQINQLAHRHMLDHARHTVRTAPPTVTMPARRNWRVVGFGAVIALLATILILQDHINAWFQGTAPHNDTTPPPAATSPVIEPLATETVHLDLPTVTEPDAASVTPAPDTAPPSDSADAAAATAAAPTTETIASTPAPVTEPPQSETTATPLRDKAWLLAQDPKGYTLQLVGAARPATIDAFLAQTPLDGDHVLYQTLYRGKPWFVLVYGTYPTRSTARTAASALAARHQLPPPWIRRLAEVQTEAQRVE